MIEDTPEPVTPEPVTPELITPEPIVSITPDTPEVPEVPEVSQEGELPQPITDINTFKAA